MDQSSSSLSFAQLFAEDQELRDLRAEYRNSPAEERTMAAAFHYDASMASYLFGNALLGSGLAKEAEDFRDRYPAAFIALAIDPLYPPALLTVGSVDYQHSHISEAMTHFQTLVALPDNDELATIIDKAGDFLLDQEDYENALALYSAAAGAHPHRPIFYCGEGYCLDKLERFEEVMNSTRKAVELEPNNARWVNDLGYCLLQLGRFDEAKDYLERAVELAPPDYEQPRNNLDERRFFWHKAINSSFLVPVIGRISGEFRGRVT